MPSCEIRKRYIALRKKRINLSKRNPYLRKYYYLGIRTFNLEYEIRDLTSVGGNKYQINRKFKQREVISEGWPHVLHQLVIPICV